MRSSKFLTSCAFMLAMASLAACGEHDSSDRSDKNQPLSAREEGIIRIAHVNESAGDLAAAERQYKQAAAMSGKTVGARLELADFYKRHNASAAAVEVLSEAHNIQPKNTEITRTLANAYINAGSPGKALTLLNDATTSNEKDPLLYNSRGVALDMLGHYSEAQSAYQTALQLDPQDDVTFKTNLSMSYILSGSYNKAITLLMPLLNSPEATPNIRQNLALAYGLSGQSDKALKLGLKDLTPQEAEENLKFYRMLAASSDAPKKVNTAHSSSSVAAANNPFMEDADQDDNNSPPVTIVKPAPVKVTAKKISPTPAPIEDVDKNITDEDDIPPPAPTHIAVAAPAEKILPVKAPIISQQPSHVPAEDAVSSTIPRMALPEPVLKPDQLN